MRSIVSELHNNKKTLLCPLIELGELQFCKFISKPRFTHMRALSVSIDLKKWAHFSTWPKQVSVSYTQ